MDPTFLRHAALVADAIPPSGPEFLGQPPTGFSPPEPIQAQMLDAMPQLIWWRHGQQAYCNRAWRAFAGDFFPADWLQLVHPNDRLAAQRRWQHSLSTGDAFEAELRLRQHQGEYRWVLSLSPAHRPGSDTPRLVSCMDIHERVLGQAALAENAKLQTSMLDVSVDCIKILRTDGTLRHMNRSGCIALGVPEGETGFSMKWLDLLPPEFRPRGLKALQAARKGKNARFAGMSLAGGHAQHWDNILTPMKDEDGSVVGILCVSRDITRQREAEGRLRWISERDELTGLLNRRAFKQRLSLQLQQCKAQHSSCGLLLIDLDHFKHVNDTLGHAAGDHLLRVLSRRLENGIGEEGFVARLGGDEFAIVIAHAPDEAHLLAAAQRILRHIESPIHFGGKIINGGMSIGCALYPRDAQDAQSLMKQADTALNDLKAGGRGGARVFNTSMMAVLQRTTSQLERARRIVREDNIQAFYQPKVHLLDHSLQGFEALLRWHSPECDGPQLPHTVEEAFKDYELATKISERMQARVFRDMAQWMEAGLQLRPVSINAAPVEFMRDDFAERLLAHMQRYGIAPHLIEVEITEHMLAERGAAFVLRALQHLKQAGVRIALDDFGTGHSSLAHLRDYPVDALKIDCDFVRRMEHEHTIYAIVQAIAKLAPI